MSQAHRMIPVWFFIGVLLLIYGVIILLTAIVEFSRPAHVVLAQYHAGLWGGLLLLAIGGAYTFFFWPGRRRRG